jgi:hypothetical protein
VNLSELVRRPDLEAGARVPGPAIRVFLGVLGVLLTLVAYGSSGWLGVGIMLSVIAAVAPEYLCAWLLILFLAVGELAHHAGFRWQLLVLLAGVQLLHILGMLALELPWRSWIQPGVFARPLRLFVAVQVPSQALAVAALLLLAPNSHGHRPLTLAAFALIGAAALAGLALLLLRSEHPRPDSQI